MVRAAEKEAAEGTLAEDAEPPKRAANFVSGYETMPVVFTPSGPVGATA